MPATQVFAAFSAQSTNSETTTALVIATTRVNLRSGPGATYPILAKLEPGATVTILNARPSNGWLRVQIAGTSRTGWISAELLQLDTSTAQTSLLPTPTSEAATALLPTPTAEGPQADATATDAAQLPTPTTVAAAADSAVQTSTEPIAVVRPPNMNVRGGPGTQYPIVSSLRAGSQVPVLALGPNRDWLQVQISGVEQAWVSASLVEPNRAVANLPLLTAEQVPPAPVAATEPTAEAPTTAEQSAAAPTAAPAPVAAVNTSALPAANAGFFAYGIQAHLWQNADKGGIVSQIHGIGFTWVKSQLRWEFVEDSPGNVNWHEPDQIIDAMYNNGINVMFSVFTAPQWSRPGKPGTGGPPDDFNLYADFVGKISGRYCGRLGAIEVWNEQNLQREWEGHALDAAQYMDLLRRAYTAIKNACPSIIVISGAPTPSGNSPVAIDDVDYLRGMYANGLAQYSDGIGVHPSGFANPPEVTVQDWQQGRYTAPPSHFDHRSFYFRSTMEEYRAVMVAAGDSNKRLWPTEFGWGSTTTPHPGYEYEANTTEWEQGQFIGAAFVMMRDWGWVGVPFLWNLNFNEGEMAAFRVVGRPAYDVLKSLPR